MSAISAPCGLHGRTPHLINADIHKTGFQSVRIPKSVCSFNPKHNNKLEIGWRSRSSSYVKASKNEERHDDEDMENLRSTAKEISDIRQSQINNSDIHQRQINRGDKNLPRSAEEVAKRIPHLTFIRDIERDATGDSVRARFFRMINKLQSDITLAVEKIEGRHIFREDVWNGPEGRGGITRVLEGGNVWEKGGVNLSMMYGTLPPDHRVSISMPKELGDVPFVATGISSVMHPVNPFVPTMHFNFRYFETNFPKDMEAPKKWWFGGGIDLTPSYLFEEDVKHFHMTHKRACDKFDTSFYPRFKKSCDEYFFIKHRDERRGVGGIFFDDLNEYDQEKLLSLLFELASCVITSYIPLVEKRKDTPYSEKHKYWQQLRRGRYTEFNLVDDRGTSFGLKIGAKVESVLMSLPPIACWQYDYQPEEGSDERKLLDVCISPKDWV